MITLENEQLTLTLDPAERGVNVLVDRIAGDEYAAPAFGVVRVYDSTEDRIWVQILAPKPGSETVVLYELVDSPTTATARVRLGGKGNASAMGDVMFGIEFDVRFVLSGNTVEITVPHASLGEHIPERFRLHSIEILPRLGATRAGVPGYLFIPSWSGGVYYFDRRHPRANPDFAVNGAIERNSEPGLQSLWGRQPDAPAEYGSLVYGVQAAWEDQLQLPVYGTIRDGCGLGGLCIGGAFDTVLLASRDQGQEHRAAVYPRWMYRHHWHSKVDTEDRKIRLVALRGEEASYSGLANLCREFVCKELGAKPLRARAEACEAIRYFRDSIRCNIMFGMLVQKDRITVCRTYQSFDDLRNALPLFQQAGFDKISFVLVGMNLQGHDGAHPSIFPIEYQHGGEPRFRELVEAIQRAGYRCGIHANYKDVYRCSPDWDESYIQVNEYGELRFHGAWMGGYSYQGLPHEMWRRFARRDLPRVRALGVYGHHYFDAIGSVMEETFAPGQRITRREYCEGMLQYIREGEEIFGSVGTETYIAPLIGTICNVGHCYIKGNGRPYTDGKNGYSLHGLIDHFVPVQMMVLHGLCFYGGGPEVAGRPEAGFWETPTREKVEQFKRAWDASAEWRGDLDWEFFTDHRYVTPDVSRSTFSDGTVIWVNRSRTPYRADGAEIPAEGHRVVRP